MVLAVKAWRWREAARQALATGEVDRALDLALDAQALRRTGSGEALRGLCQWLRDGAEPTGAGE